jgi:hypothetical protein
MEARSPSSEVANSAAAQAGSATNWYLSEFIAANWHRSRWFFAKRIATMYCRLQRHSRIAAHRDVRKGMDEDEVGAFSW